MSYSRWMNSYWYTFWSCASGPEKDDQVFEICSIAQVTYGQMRQMFGITRIIKKLHLKMHEMDVERGHEPSKEDYMELVVYMKRFMKDVDQAFKENPNYGRDCIRESEERVAEFRKERENESGNL